jgi:hypothetical protein
MRRVILAVALLSCKTSQDDTGNGGVTDSQLTGGDTDTDTDTDTDNPYAPPPGPHGILGPEQAAGVIYGASTFEGAGRAVLAMDADGDGQSDVVALADQAQNSSGAPPYIGVWHELPLGEHSFLDADHTITNDLLAPDSRILALGAEDLTGDGLMDLVVTRSLAYSGSEAIILAGNVSDARSLSEAYANVLFEQDASDVAWFPVPDVTGDSQPDLIAGEYLAYDGGDSSGKAYVFSGPLDGRRESDTAHAVLDSLTKSEELGKSIAAADFNGDGIGDLVVPAVVEHIYVLSGPIDGDENVQTSYSARYTYDPLNVNNGLSIYTTPVFAGDLDGDGLADLAFGSQDLRVIVGPIQGQLDEDSVSAKLPGATGFAAGDVNGDGTADLLVGDGEYNPGVSAEQGAAYLYYGPMQGTASAEEADFQTSKAQDQVGASVALGDLDSDGFADLVIGAPGLDAGGLEAGAVLIYPGGP